MLLLQRICVLKGNVMLQHRSSEFAPSVSSIQRHLSAVEKELENIGRVAGRRGSVAAKNASDQIGDALTPILNDLIERFRQGGRQAVEAGSSYGNSAARRVSAGVEAQPLITIAVALGVGALIGATVIGANWRK
jgi:ElaB/YqjD/DUF883 family membrane-anchored ribosome-binding protein